MMKTQKKKKKIFGTTVIQALPEVADNRELWNISESSTPRYETQRKLKQNPKFSSSSYSVISLSLLKKKKKDVF